MFLCAEEYYSALLIGVEILQQIIEKGAYKSDGVSLLGMQHLVLYKRLMLLFCNVSTHATHYAAAAQSAHLLQDKNF